MPPICWKRGSASVIQIQSYLGHDSLASTAIYTHLSQKGEAEAVAVINQLMADLP